MLNARTDTYMAKHPDAFAETIRRAQQYVDSGADCIFVPGVSDADEIGRLTAEIDAPVNVVAGLVEPVLDAATLRELGVARISIGGTLTRAALTLVESAAGRCSSTAHSALPTAPSPTATSSSGSTADVLARTAAFRGHSQNGTWALSSESPRTAEFTHDLGVWLTKDSPNPEGEPPCT